MLNLLPLPKHRIGFGYIFSKDYELDLNFDDIYFLKQSDHTSNDKVLKNQESAVLVEEEWFNYMNWTDGATFMTALIKFAKTRVNQKINFPHETKQRIQ